MASKATVQVEARELRRALRQIGDQGLKDTLKAANKTAAQRVVDVALPNVPVRTGRLKASVRALGSQAAGQAKAGTAKVDYAAAIHWGRIQGNVWGGKMGVNPIKGRPFLWDAAQVARPAVIDEYRESIDHLMNLVRNAHGGA